MAKQKIIVGFTGYSAAGKSTAARHISETLSVPYYGLGTYERAKFGHLGSPVEYHRKLGTDITYYGLYKEHIEQIRSRFSNGSIVIESLYAPDFVSLLRKTFQGFEIKIIHVYAPKEVRITNFATKAGISHAESEKYLDALDAIKIGFGLLEMIRKADIVVENRIGLSKFLRDIDIAASRLSSSVSEWKKQ